MSNAQIPRNINYQTSEKTAVAMIESMAYMLAERHGDDMPAVGEILGIANDIKRGKKNEAVHALDDLAQGLGFTKATPSHKLAVRDMARTALVLMNGCDW